VLTASEIRTRAQRLVESSVREHGVAGG